jgi:hypothetical protein
MIRLTCHAGTSSPAEKQEARFAIDNAPPLQGRSAYVCRNARCLGEALKAKKFQRTLKRAIPDDILRSLNVQLEGMKSE